MSLFQDTYQTKCIPAANRAFGVTVALTHGTFTTEPFVAIRENHTYEVADSQGFLTAFHSRDFMFDRADCRTASGSVIEPRAGDVIRLTENGVDRRFEILPVGNLPAVETMEGNYRWKVHTKELKG